MKKLMAFFALFTAAASVSAAQAPVSVQLINAGSNVRYVRVISNANSVVVNNVIVNRGNCGVASSGQSRDIVEPIRLNYGSFSNYRTYINSCVIREIQVMTDQGNWTFNVQ